MGGTVATLKASLSWRLSVQFQHDVGRENTCLIHVTLIPYLKASGEMKTKPTQASVKTMQGMGLQPDILVCRSEYPMDARLREKIAQFCNVAPNHVLQNLDCDILYEVPLDMEKEQLAPGRLRLPSHSLSRTGPGRMEKNDRRLEASAP